MDTSGNYIVGGVAIVGAPVFALARYTSGGTPDSLFGASGIVTTTINDSSEAYGDALQSDGQIVAGGRSIIQDVLILR